MQGFSGHARVQAPGIC